MAVWLSPVEAASIDELIFQDVLMVFIFSCSLSTTEALLSKDVLYTSQLNFNTSDQMSKLVLWTFKRSFIKFCFEDSSHQRYLPTICLNGKMGSSYNVLTKYGTQKRKQQSWM